MPVSLNNLELKPKQVLQLLNPIFFFVLLAHQCTNFQEKKVTAGIQ